MTRADMAVATVSATTCVLSIIAFAFGFSIGTSRILLTVAAFVPALVGGASLISSRFMPVTKRPSGPLALGVLIACLLVTAGMSLFIMHVYALSDA
jgi:hypothetical protein